MDGPLILGLDVGGSFVKVTAFDVARGRAVTRGRPVPVQHPAPGHNERDGRVMWHAATEVIHEVIGLLPAGSRPTAVGVTGHGNGLYLVDRRGRPTRHAVMASDTRSAPAVRAMIHAGVQDELAPLTWNRLWPGQPGPILAWLKEHEPRTLAESSYALMCKDFVRTQLVGEVSTEITDQSCNGLYDNCGDRYCDEAFDAWGLRDERRLMLEPAASSDVVGHVTLEAEELTGIPRGTPVVAGVVDNVALHLGSGVLDSSRICVAAGTWSVNQLLVRREEMVPGHRLGASAPFAACISAEPARALLIDASPTSASTLAWAVDHVMRGLLDQAARAGSDVFELALRRVAAHEPTASDAFFVPYLDGSRDNPAARGAWLNLASWHDEDALLSAVVEGICMEHRRHVDRISADDADLPLRLSGGASKSATWAQRFADVTGRRVEVSSAEELGALGAAVIAGVGVGVFDTLASGAAALNPRRVAFTPDDEAAAHFERRFARYCEIADWVAQPDGP